MIDKIPPTGALITVIPTDNGLNTAIITFTEAVTNFDLSELQLTRDDAPVSLVGAKLASADDGKTWTLSNIAGMTKSAGDYKLSVNRGDIKDLAGNGLTTGSSGSFRMADRCIFGTPIVVPKLKGKKGMTLKGSSGSDRFGGGKGKDIFKSGKNGDRIKGGGGSDRMNGDNGKDQLSGNTGRDLLDGGAGKDNLKGGGGKDRLIGGNGKDRLVGGNGPDILIGGGMSDTLKGGKGKDMYVFSGLSSEGTDVIKRFESNKDVIDLRPMFARSEFTGATLDAKFHQYVQIEQVGSSTEVRVDLDGAGAGNVFGAIAMLKGINASTIGCSNFVVS
jgi:large repetitive protein